MKNINIVGGGLAGLSLGILLRRSDVPVELWEAGAYPRHRVCGEFISGSGVAVLKDLGILTQVECLRAQSVRFFTPAGSSAPMLLPDSALCVSRFKLDQGLAKSFTASGGELYDRQRWVNDFDREGVVRATGRRFRQTEQTSWLGLKVHARQFSMSADLELHFSESGYVGVAKLPSGEVNICALLKRGRSVVGRSQIPSFLANLLFDRTKEELENAEFDQASFSAVAGLSLRRERARDEDECRLGDSICMIPPLTGNGMSMALESAQAAAPVLIEYSRGRMDWTSARKQVAKTCDKLFSSRLRYSAVFQKLLGTGVGRRLMLSSFRTMPWLLQFCFRRTR